mgnify:FL=1
MARRAANEPLKVYLNSRLVGTLSREASGATYFQYNPSWLEWDNGFAISLSLPLREERYAGAPVTAVFDNLLPDNDAIRRRLAERTGAEGADAYSLLAAIGRDCVGALQFLPAGEEPWPAGLVKAEPIANAAIARKLAALERAPLGIDTAEDFRISIAGVQGKTALLYYNGAWHIPHGATPTTHILKPQIGMLGGHDLSQSVENEHFCMQLLAAMGLPVAETAIENFNGQRVLVITRFDRRWTQDNRLLRLPQEDCCQALSVPPTLKYEADGGPGMVEILELLKGADRPRTDQETFLQAQIAFWLLAATDGHAKNFSIALYPGGGFELTPLYDVISAQPLFAARELRKEDLRLAMAVGDNRHYRIHEVMPRHFVQTAARAGLPPHAVERLISEMIETVPGAITQVTENLPADFPTAVSGPIIQGLRRRLKRLAVAPA